MNLKIYLNRVNLVEVFFLIFLVLASFTLRLKGITNTGLWNDEFWTVYFSSARHIKTVWEMFEFLGSKMAENPPLYPTVMRFWVHFFGDSEYAIRLPSVIFGSLSVPALYFCLKEIVNKRVGVISGILLIFSPVHIHYSQEARTYALFFLLSLFSMYFFSRLNKNFTKRNVLGYTAATILMLYSHYYAFFLLAGQAILLLFIGKHVWQWLAIVLGIFLFFVPWVPSLINQTLGFSQGSWVGRVGVGEALISQIEFFTPTVPRFPLGLIFKLLFIFGIAKVIALSVKRKQFAITLLIWLLFPILIPLLISQFTQPFFVDRFSFITFAAFLAIIAVGIDLLLIFNKIFLIPLGVVLYFLILSSQYPFLGVKVEGWRSMVPFVEEVLDGSETPVVLNPNTPATRTAIEYYTKGGRINLVSQENLEKSKNCYKRFYLISRPEKQNISLKSRYRKTTTLFNESPHLYEYELRN